MGLKGTGVTDGKTVMFVLSAVLLLLLVSSSLGLAYQFHPPPVPPAPPKASVVIGQPDFNSSSGGSGKTGLASPQNIAVDSSGDLWVSDYQNGWVTEYAPPFTNGESAALELGAANFSAGGCATGNPLCEPSGVAFDPNGNLWAGDTQNASVQEFKAPFATGEEPSVMLGGSYLGSTPTSRAFAPAGLTFDSSGNLWVADGGANRILEFSPPFTNRQAASLVLGQPDFTTDNNNSTQSMLSSPGGLAFDSSGNLWVADTYDNRVVEYRAPFSNGESASLAIGQPDLVSTGGNTTQSTFDQPDSVAFDSHGNLWVADAGNNRVAEFTSPFSTGMNATVIIGQDSYFFSEQGVAQASLYDPEGVAAAGGGNLWVADTGNDRVLLFVNPSAAAAVSTTASQTTTGPQLQTSQVQTTNPVSTATTGTTSGGIPEFPYQFVVMGIVTLFMVGSYLAARRLVSE